MTSKVIKTRSGYKMQFRDEEGRILRPSRAQLPSNPEAERRSHMAVQEVLRRMYEAQLTVGA